MANEGMNLNHNRFPVRLKSEKGELANAGCAARRPHISPIENRLKFFHRHPDQGRGNGYRYKPEGWAGDAWNG